MSAMSIVASLAIMGGATFAFFSSSATSNDNLFGAGSLNLELDDLNEAFGVGPDDDLLTAPFNVPSMAPGDSAAQEISFHNTGSVPMEEIAMGLNCAGTDGDSNFCDVLDILVRVGGTASEGSCSGGDDETPNINSEVSDGSGSLTLSEFNGDTYDSLPIALAANDLAPGGADESKVCIQVSMQESAVDIYQADTADVDLTFTAHQNALSQ